MTTITIVTKIHASPERCFDASRDLDLHLESMGHTGERAVAGRTSGLIELGEQVTWEGRHFRDPAAVHVRDHRVRPVGTFSGFEPDPSGNWSSALHRYEHRHARRMYGEHLRVEPVLLVVAALLGEEQGLVRRSLRRVIDRDRLRLLGLCRNRQNNPGAESPPRNSHKHYAAFAAVLILKSFFALSSKISFLSAALSQSKASMMTASHPATCRCADPSPSRRPAAPYRTDIDPRRPS